MERFTDPLMAQYGVRLIIGKGGLREGSLAAFKRYGGAYLAVIGGALLVVGGERFRHLRGRIAARIEADALIAPRQRFDLRRPAQKVAGKFVQEDDRLAMADDLHGQGDAVLRRNRGAARVLLHRCAIVCMDPS